MDNGNGSKKEGLDQATIKPGPKLSSCEYSEKEVEFGPGVKETTTRQSVPDSQVLERPERRKFSVEYKARIVREADACTEAGQIGALLRREGLYSSQLVSWRRLYREGALKALKDDKRGRKQIRNPLEAEVESLKKKNLSLEKRLAQAEAIIDIQKNSRRCWEFRSRTKETNNGRSKRICACIWYCSDGKGA
jgi:transposase